MISSKMSIEDRSEEGLTDLEFFQNMRETSRRLHLDVASTAADIQSISKELQPKYREAEIGGSTLHDTDERSE